MRNVLIAVLVLLPVCSFAQTAMNVETAQKSAGGADAAASPRADGAGHASE